MTAPSPAERAEAFRNHFNAVFAEIAKAIVGQTEVVNQTLIALFAGGHVLLEGVPGLGKTHLVRSLSQALGVQFSRIQFTPDLMPADILGTNLIVEDADGRKRFEFQPGPVFTQILLADEINRATPKTQSALLEAMQERSLTVAGETRKLGPPFFVLATQNPLEMEGTYPLPEAQLDRFIFKVNVPYPDIEDLIQIARRTTGEAGETIVPCLNADEIQESQNLVREVAAAPHVERFAARLVLGSHPETEQAPDRVKRFVRYGASPRAIQALLLAGKVRALLDSRLHVSFDDLISVVRPVLRHRMIFNFEGEAEGVRADDLIADIIGAVPREAPGA